MNKRHIRFRDVRNPISCQKKLYPSSALPRKKKKDSGVSEALGYFAVLQVLQHTVKRCRNTRLVLCCLAISEYSLFAPLGSGSIPNSRKESANDGGTFCFCFLNCSFPPLTFRMSKGRELGDCSLGIPLSKRGTRGLY